MVLKHLLTNYFILLPMTVLDKIKCIIRKILELSDAVMTKSLLIADNPLSASSNTLTLITVIDSVISTKRFDNSKITIWYFY